MEDIERPAEDLGGVLAGKILRPRKDVGPIHRSARKSPRADVLLERRQRGNKLFMPDEIASGLSAKGISNLQLMEKEKRNLLDLPQA
jgi:hypothetical protein